MAKARLKTVATDASPWDFVSRIENVRRREDARVLLTLFGDTTGLVPRLWGNSIVGYGRYHYRYESGREGEYFMTGFSPRKAAMSIYIMPGYQDLSEMLVRLGKHRVGKSCLYVNKLADIDLRVLEEIIRFGVDYMTSHYQTFPD